MKMYLFLKDGSPQRIWGGVDTGMFRWTFSARLQEGKHSIPNRNCVTSLFHLAGKRFLSGWEQVLPMVTVDDERLRDHLSFDVARIIYENIIHELRWTGRTHTRLSAQQVALESLRRTQFPIVFARFMDGEAFEDASDFPLQQDPRIIIPYIAPQASWAF